jgi:hypothetical protein
VNTAILRVAAPDVEPPVDRWRGCRPASRRSPAAPVSHELRALGDAEAAARAQRLALARDTVLALTTAQHQGADCSICGAAIAHLAERLGVSTASIRASLLVAVESR